MYLRTHACIRIVTRCKSCYYFSFLVKERKHASQRFRLIEATPLYVGMKFLGTYNRACIDLTTFLERDPVLISISSMNSLKKCTWNESLIIFLSLRKLIDSEEWIGESSSGKKEDPCFVFDSSDESRNGERKEKAVKEKMVRRKEC